MLTFTDRHSQFFRITWCVYECVCVS